MNDESHEPLADLQQLQDDSFTEDLPCVRCGYNLRGLKPEGNCPECGAAISKSLEFALERILCLACMKPNHPSAAVCSGCGAPLHAAGATANYFRITPRGVRRTPGVDEETQRELDKLAAQKKSQYMPRPHAAGVVAIGLISCPLAVTLGVCAGNA